MVVKSTRERVCQFWLGEHDNNLRFPFRGTLLTQIVNVRDEHKKHIEKPITFSNSTDPTGKFGARVAGVMTWFSSGRSFQGYGFPDMLSHEYLGLDETHNTQYLSDDDSLTLRVTKIDIEN